MRPTAAPGPFPYRWHRTVEQADRQTHQGDETEGAVASIDVRDGSQRLLAAIKWARQ